MRVLGPIRDLRSLAVFLGAVLLGSICPAADDDPCGCNAVLHGGVYNYRSKRGDASADKDVTTFLKNATYDEFKKASMVGGGFSVAGIGFNASDSQTEFQKHQSELIQKSKEIDTTTTSEELLERYGDSNVLGAWSACKSTCSVRGITSWFTREGDDDHWALHIVWTPFPGAANPTVQSSTLSGGRVPGERPGRILSARTVLPVGETKRMIVRDDVKKAVTITVGIPGMDVVHNIPPVIAPLPLPPPGVSFVACKESVTLQVCRNGGALSTTGALCDEKSWGPKDPIKVCTDVGSPRKEFYVCDKGGAVGSHPNFCGYLLGRSSSPRLLSLRLADDTCAHPRKFLVCWNGGAMGTSGNFCDYMNWNPATEAVETPPLCVPE
jgi:hypothetical protein